MKSKYMTHPNKLILFVVEGYDSVKSANSSAQSTKAFLSISKPTSPIKKGLFGNCTVVQGFQAKKLIALVPM